MSTQDVRLPQAEPSPRLVPVGDYLAELHARVRGIIGGRPADYIPELSKVDPKLFGIDLFKGLTPAEYKLIETLIRPLTFDKGEIIIREGADAKLFFVVARGTVSVQIRIPGQDDQQEARGVDRAGFIRRDGVAGWRQAVRRYHRRRTGDLLRARRRAAARAGRRAPQHHDHHSQQSDARVLRALRHANEEISALE